VIEAIESCGNAALYHRCDVLDAESLAAIGAEIGMTLTVENNNFTGSCAASWNGGAKGMIGA